MILQVYQIFVLKRKIKKLDAKIFKYDDYTFYVYAFAFKLYHYHLL